MIIIVAVSVSYSAVLSMMNSKAKHIITISA